MGMIKDSAWAPIPVPRDFPVIRKRWKALPMLLPFVKEVRAILLQHSPQAVGDDASGLDTINDIEGAGGRFPVLTFKEQKKLDNASALKVNEIYHYEVVGIYYTGNGYYLNQLPTKTELMLQIEPGNSYDCFAVSVWHAGKKLGYIPKRKNIPVYKTIITGDLNISCLLGAYMPSTYVSNYYRERRRFNPERAKITVHTLQNKVEWRKIEFSPEDNIAF
jgi:hypothetical protein